MRKTRPSRRYAENQRDMAVFQGWRPSETLFRKKQIKAVFRCNLGEGVSGISGLYRFSFGQEA